MHRIDCECLTLGVRIADSWLYMPAEDVGNRSLVGRTEWLRRFPLGEIRNIRSLLCAFLALILPPPWPPVFSIPPCLRLTNLRILLFCANFVAFDSRSSSNSPCPRLFLLLISYPCSPPCSPYY